MQNHKIVSAISYAVIALLGAFVLWIYVVTTVTPEITASFNNVPITLQGSSRLEENGLMVATEDRFVNLEVRGARTNVKRLTAENIRVTADLSTITQAGTYSLDLEISFPAVSGNGSIEVLRKNLSSVSVVVTKVDNKTLPVEVEWEGSAPEGYYFDSTNILVEMASGDAAEVVVTGPESEIAPVARAVILCGDISDLTETVIETYPIFLLDDNGEVLTLSEYVSIDETQATVTLPILKNKELTLTVTLVDGGGATGEDAELTYSTEKLAVRGTKSIIDELSDEYNLGVIDLSQVGMTDTKTFKITLPAGVKNVSGITDVEVTIRLKGLKETTIFVDAADIALLNIPQNAVAQLTAEKIPVTLRGPADSIANITGEDLTITVDLSNMTGDGERQATITVPDYTDVGVVGTVMVEIDLS